MKLTTTMMAGGSALHAGQWMRIDANRSRPSEHRATEAQCSNGPSLFESLKRFTMSLLRSLRGMSSLSSSEPTGITLPSRTKQRSLTLPLIAVS